MALEFNKYRASVPTWWKTFWCPTGDRLWFIDGKEAFIVILAEGNRLCIMREANPSDTEGIVGKELRYKILAYPETLDAAFLAFELMAAPKE